MTEDIVKQKKIKLYEFLWAEADKIVREHNPCGFVDGKCVGNAEWCCEFCPYSTSTGCGTKSAGCRAHLCRAAMNNTTPEVRGKLGMLTGMLVDFGMMAVGPGLREYRLALPDFVERLDSGKVDSVPCGENSCR